MESRTRPWQETQIVIAIVTKIGTMSAANGRTRTMRKNAPMENIELAN
jgi:hypothetical protein